MEVKFIKIKKLLVILLVTFSLLCSIIQIPISSEDPDPKTIYVDDDFEDDPVNNEWNTRQEGIDNAENGDTVVILPSVHHDDVHVCKQLIIRSSSVDPSDTIVYSVFKNKSIITPKDVYILERI